MIVAVMNNKGGVGKTTSAVNLSAAWAHAGQRTLLVDLDSQCSASLHLGLRHGVGNVEELLHKGTPSPQPTCVEGLDLLPGSPRLANFDLEAAGRKGRELLLREGLRRLPGGYNRIVLDCPPSLSLITVNALGAADGLLVPVTPSYLAVEGLVQFLASLQQVSQALNRRPRLLGILLTMVDPRMRLTSEIIAMLRQHYGEKVLRTEIKGNVKLAEASSFGQSIFEYDRRCPGARLYQSLSDELEEKCREFARVA